MRPFVKHPILIKTFAPEKSFAFSSLLRVKIIAKRLLLLLLFIGVLLTACNTPPDSTAFSDTKMFIRYKIVVGHPLTQADLQKIRDAIANVFEEVDITYNQWNPVSEVSRINNTPFETPIILSEPLAQFFAIVDQGALLSNSRFEPTIEPAVQLWKESLERGSRPDELAIATLRPAIGWKTLRRTNRNLSKTHTATKLNFDGVAKGYCVDRLLEELNTLGYSNLYVEWGGEIRVSGHHPAGRPWRVMVTGVGGSEGIEAIDLINSAVATSGDYYQQWVVSEEATTTIYTHIIDPFTLQALEVRPQRVASATVIAPTCALADMLATTCMLFSTAEEAEIWASEIKETIPGTEFWIITRE